MPPTTSRGHAFHLRTTGGQARRWGDAWEKYKFKDVDGGTEFVIDVDTREEMESFTQETWPKALRRLKATCEARA